MEQRIHCHFRETQCMLVLLEKSVAFMVKIAKISNIKELNTPAALKF
jgi:hypothetical protein